MEVSNPLANTRTIYLRSSSQSFLWDRLVSTSLNIGPICVWNLGGDLSRNRVTVLDWTSDNTSFVSCSKDFTVKFYAANEPHSLATLQMETGVCGVHQWRI